MKIFVSYSWKQHAWLKRYLIPLLDACGHEALVDYRCFSGGRNNKAQMDAFQDQADRQLLLLSKDYLKSDYCMHELRRAVARWGLNNEVVLPVCYEADALPPEVTDSGVLYVGPLANWDADHCSDHWGLLGRSLDLDPGVAPDVWVRARSKVWDFLQRGDSVNLVADKDAPWRLLVQSLAQDQELGLGLLDYEAGYATSLPHLVRRILALAGINRDLFPPEYALAELSEQMEACDTPSRQAWLHFSHIISKSQRTNGEGMYNTDFFAAVRNLAEQRKLNLLLHSRQPVADWLEKDHQLSKVDFKTVML